MTEKSKKILAGQEKIGGHRHGEVCCDPGGCHVENVSTRGYPFHNGDYETSNH